jgi:hypothetical protein
MRNRVICSFALAFACAFLSVPSVTAQNGASTQKPVPPPRPGVLNLADDGTQLRREDEPDWVAVAARKRVREGDSLRTTGTARAEMLLMPGAYLRLDRNTEIEMLDDAPDRLGFAVRRGAVIFEISGPPDGIEGIRVETPTGNFVLLQSGLYRVQTPGRNSTEIRLHRGLIELQNENFTRFEGRRRIYLDADGYGIGAYYKLEADAFDTWSEGRSRRLTEANAKLRQDELRRQATANRPTGATSRSHQTGTWVYAERNDTYTYYPNVTNCSTPYGYTYPTCDPQPSEPVYVISEHPAPIYQSPVKPPAQVWTPPQPPGPDNPPQPGMYNAGPPNPGMYNTGPINPEKPESVNQPLPPDDYRNGPPPQARDKAPGINPNSNPPPVQEAPTSGNGGANGGGYNTGGQPPANDAKPAPVQPSQPPPQAQPPAKPAPAPQPPTKAPIKD